jgi:hypothetical protein
LVEETLVDNDPEVEPDDVVFQDIDDPWDPEDIRVSTRSFSLRNMIDMIAEGGLDLAPDFQRLQVWGQVQKVQLIESVLLQIPLPAFYFAEDATGVMQVVDGVQRLSTINDFVTGDPSRGGGFPLVGLEYLIDVKGKRFKDLPAVWKRRIHNTQIVAHVIEPSTPPVVMYDIFRRINTGGTPLRAQEIRHCVSKQRSRAFLKELAATAAFENATGGVLKNHRRMVDRELALRFVAFWCRGPAGYLRSDSLESFLLRVTRSLDDESEIDDLALADIKSAFERGLTLAHEVFGHYAFRKWPTGLDRLAPINRALFETWTVELARADQAAVRENAEKIRNFARQGMASDTKYIGSISNSTGDVRSVHMRFGKTREFIQLAIGT